MSHHRRTTGSVPPGIGVVEGGEIPYKPEALAKKKENFANRLKLDPEVKCYLPGVPRATYMPYPFQIVQSQKVTMFVYEYAGGVRTVYMDTLHDDVLTETVRLRDLVRAYSGAPAGPGGAEP